MKDYIIVIGLILILTSSTYGQAKCSKENFIGEWRQVESILGFQTNLDSLKNIISNSNKTIGVLNLKADGTYTYTFMNLKTSKSKPYFIATETCEIILGAKRKARKKSNLQILYLDSEILIFGEDNNPKGYITHLNVKK